MSRSPVSPSAPPDCSGTAPTLPQGFRDLRWLTYWKKISGKVCHFQQVLFCGVWRSSTHPSSSSPHCCHPGRHFERMKSVLQASTHCGVGVNVEVCSTCILPIIPGLLETA
eukprot:Hpha_TRINITY_DN34992_c0_g1::TRINITY_DN34992_c0_g1_i1::g.184064::m.184064